MLRMPASSLKRKICASLVAALALISVPLVCYASGDVAGELWQPAEGAELIGRPAPDFSGLKWLNSKPLDIEDLRGKVVLIRFWLVDCPFCENTAPSLVELYDKYGDEGFIVIGIHHPKSERANNNDLVLKTAKKLGFEFPIAQDKDWKTINAYWLGETRRSYTSSSILIDKKGIIRFVHDGGEFYSSPNNPEADLAYRTIDEKIKELLDED